MTLSFNLLHLLRSNFTALSLCLVACASSSEETLAQAGKNEDQDDCSKQKVTCSQFIKILTDWGTHNSKVSSPLDEWDEIVTSRYSKQAEKYKADYEFINQVGIYKAFLQEWEVFLMKQSPAFQAAFKATQVLRGAEIVSDKAHPRVCDLNAERSEQEPSGRWLDLEKIEVQEGYVIEADSVDFRSAILRKAVLISNELSLLKNSFRNADFRGADLSWTYLNHTNLREALLDDANLTQAQLGGAKLGGASLLRADLPYANLSWADLSGANLMKADLSDAALHHTNLAYANLRHADLKYAAVEGANLSHAILVGARLLGVDLSKAASIENVNMNDERSP